MRSNNPAKRSGGAAASAGEVIVFYDGDCGLCSRAVRILLRADRRGRLRFAPLQGATAQERLTPVLEASGRELLGSMAVWRGPRSGDGPGEVTFDSSAVLAAFGALGGLWRLAGWLRVVPRPWRDGVYRWVARNRLRWFGGGAACLLPGPEERARFLS